MGSEIPFKPAEDLFGMIGPAIAVLVLLLALAWAALLGAKRFGFAPGRRGAANRLRVLERVALSRRSSLLVVEWEGRTLLLGQSGDQVRLIASGDKPATSEDKPATSEDKPSASGNPLQGTG
jgi:flagellar biogenesis protein FliO